MKNLTYVPTEQLMKEETQYIKESWNSPIYEFLMSRSTQKYTHKATATRRRQIESQLNIELPPITDEMLIKLYLHACSKYQRKCNSTYNEKSGFLKTPQERVFLETLKSILSKHSKLKHLEIYPSPLQSTDLPPDFKYVVGNYVPDFVVFGLKTKKSSGIVFEIDGESHSKKHQKDLLRNEHLLELNLFTIEIPNNQVTDFDYIESLMLKLLKIRTGSLNQQIQRTKRMIWLKTISCQLSLNEIESLVKAHFQIQLNLLLEAERLIRHPDCPRNIKRDLLKLSLS